MRKFLRTLWVHLNFLLALMSAFLLVGAGLALADQYGWVGMALVTGVATWGVLAAIGLLIAIDRAIDFILKNNEIRIEFVRWYISRKKQEREPG